MKFEVYVYLIGLIPSVCDMTSVSNLTDQKMSQLATLQIQYCNINGFNPK